MIPTADALLKKHLINKLETKKDSSQDRANAINEAMIEFAKLHVTEALKEASKVSGVRAGNCFMGEGTYVDTKNEILNAYPLNKIV